VDRQPLCPAGRTARRPRPVSLASGPGRRGRGRPGTGHPQGSTSGQRRLEGLSATWCWLLWLLLSGRAVCPALGPGGRCTPWHAARPPGASGGANEVGHASPRRSMAIQGPGWCGSSVPRGWCKSRMHDIALLAPRTRRTLAGRRGWDPGRTGRCGATPVSGPHPGVVEVLAVGGDRARISLSARRRRPLGRLRPLEPKGRYGRVES
jgi:hypothetical protein